MEGILKGSLKVLGRRVAWRLALGMLTRAIKGTLTFPEGFYKGSLQGSIRDL